MQYVSSSFNSKDIQDQGKRMFFHAEFSQYILA